MTCFLWFHDWGQWEHIPAGKPGEYQVVRERDVETGVVFHEWILQQRYCKRCNMLQVRRVEL